MKCKFCKETIPDGSLFCNWCGERQRKERNQGVKIPEPRQLPSGKWRIYLDKEKKSITRDTADECRIEARAIRAGLIDVEKKPQNTALSAAIDKYIESKSNVLSPSTLRGYKCIKDTRFLKYSNKPLSSINWQKMINDEATLCSPKTLHNAWGLVSSTVKFLGMAPPKVTLPMKVQKERPFLEPSEVPEFIAKIKDTPIAIPCLLALSSLRTSEILGLRWEDVGSDTISVRKTMVMSDGRKLVEKDTAKTSTSRRNVPIFIPELKELLTNHEGEKPCNMTYDAMNKALYRFCKQQGIARLSMHCLRHSFATLAYSLGLNELTTMKIGGWKDYGTMRKIYTHLSNKDLEEGSAKLKAFLSK